MIFIPIYNCKNIKKSHKRVNSSYCLQEISCFKRRSYTLRMVLSKEIISLLSNPIYTSPAVSCPTIEVLPPPTKRCFSVRIEILSSSWEVDVQIENKKYRL